MLGVANPSVGMNIPAFRFGFSVFTLSPFTLPLLFLVCSALHDVERVLSIDWRLLFCFKVPTLFNV